MLSYLDIVEVKGFAGIQGGSVRIAVDGEFAVKSIALRLVVQTDTGRQFAQGAERCREICLGLGSGDVTVLFVVARDGARDLEEYKNYNSKFFLSLLVSSTFFLSKMSLYGFCVCRSTNKAYEIL